MSFTEEVNEYKSFDDRHRWLLDADLTYCSGRFLLLRDDFFFRPSGGYLLHQASEKYLKALRRVVIPEIAMRKGSHNLTEILAFLEGKIEGSLFKKITESIKKVNPLEQFRYVDQKATRDIQTMKKGWEAADYLVTSVRENIDKRSVFIADKGLRRYIEGSNDKEQNLLIDSLLRNNLSAKYWINHLSGINPKIDRKLKKHQTI